MKFVKNPFFYLLLVLVALLIFQAWDVVGAQFQEPDNPFPAGVPSPPLEGSPVAQTKTGTLNLNNLYTTAIDWLPSLGFSGLCLNDRPGGSLACKLYWSLIDNPEPDHWILSGTDLYASSTDWGIGIGTDAPVSRLDIFGGDLTLRGPSPFIAMGDYSIDGRGPWEFVSYVPPSAGNDTCNGDIENFFSCALSDIGICEDIAPGMAPDGNRAYFKSEVTCVIDSATYRMGNESGIFKLINNFGTTTFTVAQGGGVGIGENVYAPPNIKLDVDGRMRVTSFQLGTSATAGYVLSRTSSNGIGSWQVNPPPIWSVAGSNIYYNSGNVGIKTTNPGSKLTVVGIIESTSGGFEFVGGGTFSQSVPAVAGLDYVRGSCTNCDEFAVSCSAGKWAVAGGCSVVTDTGITIFKSNRPHPANTGSWPLYVPATGWYCEKYGGGVWNITAWAMCVDGM